MVTFERFTFNPYQENTYLIINDDKECIIIDPGMYNTSEQQSLYEYITKHDLTPKLLLNTHCHIDHVLGNNFIYEQWGLKPLFHENEVPILIAVENYAPQMGIRYDKSPISENFIKDKQIIAFGRTNIEAILAPGHSPGHLCYYLKDQNILIGGDVLFKNSIGRTDLPGGDHQTLLNSIKNKIYTLPDNTKVLPGHGDNTLIAFEKKTNPFIKG